MTERAGLDIGLVTLSSGMSALSIISPSRAGRSTTIGADGERDDQQKLSTVYELESACVRIRGQRVDHVKEGSVRRRAQVRKRNRREDSRRRRYGIAGTRIYGLNFDHYGACRA